ncbi:hypothetical protein [Candidatus Methylocalor cossyra]
MPKSFGLSPLVAQAGRIAAWLSRRRVLRILLLTAGGSLLAAALVLGLALQEAPIEVPDPPSVHHYLDRARDLIHHTVGAGGADQKHLVLTAEDLTAAANFVLLRKRLDGRALCTIERRRLKLRASIRLPVGPLERFLNITFIADDGVPQAKVKRLTLGRLSIPAPVVGWLLHGALHFTPMARYSRVGEQLVRDVHVQEDGRLTLVLNWNRDALVQAQGLVTDLADKERLAAYHDKLAEVIDGSGLKRFVRLGLLMRPLFALARFRSAEDNDPIAENRALIIVLGAYVNGKSLSAALSARSDPGRRGVLLQRRVDTAQHFMGAAALAMAGHSTLVDVIGLAKEMNDTHHGSGFSFIDLAADQAGALFGKTAVRSEDKARKVQELLSASDDEALFMPAIRDLPENLNQAAFADRFKLIDSPEFQALKLRIQERILACPLYRQP